MGPAFAGCAGALLINPMLLNILFSSEKLSLIIALTTPINQSYHTNIEVQFAGIPYSLVEPQVWSTIKRPSFVLAARAHAQDLQAAKLTSSENTTTTLGTKTRPSTGKNDPITTSYLPTTLTSH